MGIRNKRTYLFSDRYADILNDKDFMTKFPFELSSDLYDVLTHFDEPIVVQPNRYDNWTVTSCTSTEVYTQYYKKMGFPIDRVRDVDLEWLYKRDYNEWHDIIELWSEELSAGEKAPFQEEINRVFFDYDQPWCLFEGRIIKIDAKQFEQDLIHKSLNSLGLRVCEVPIFQNALDEYIRAIEFYDKHDFKDCILYAEKSYESALKIINNQSIGQADSLLRTFVNSSFVDDLPQQLNKEGLRTTVLSAVPYLRNQLKVGHGEGGESISITSALARLVLNLSASLNSFLVDQYISHLSVSTEVSDEEDELPF